MIRALPLAVLALLASLQPAAPHSVAFDDAWQPMEFSGYALTEYSMRGVSVDIRAEASSSMVYRLLGPEDWNSTAASWDWAVEQSVVATDMSRKGGDDRNLAVYFVFLDQKAAARVKPSASVGKLLRSRRARVLIYTFGDDEAPGTVVPNPYLKKRGATILLRPASVGSFSEIVDLAADYRAAFGAEPEALVSIALAADSDDTDGLVVARISGLEIE